MKNWLSSMACILLILFCVTGTAAQGVTAREPGLKEGHPADHLPPHIKMVSGFGERPDWSHDGTRILFVEKPMGEVYELSLASGVITPKTRHFNHFGFTRAMYLSNGDILLAGPSANFDPTDRDSREKARDMCFLSVLDKSGTKKPVPLGEVCAEGPAVSRRRLTLAWTVRDRQRPELGENHARLYMGEISYANGGPAIVNKRVVFDSHQLPFPLGNASLETQNLVPPEDTKLIFSVYQIEKGNNTDTYIVDTKTGAFSNLTRSSGFYDEPEGVFPDGKFTCVEHASSQSSAWPLIDLYKLKLDGSGEMQRLTHFTDFKGFKAAQGVVSDDGKYLCFQIGKAGDEAGVGYGFFVMDLEAASREEEPFRAYTDEGHAVRMQVVADEFKEAWNAKKPLPAVTKLQPDITMAQAYDIQRAWVFPTLGPAGIGGVKAGMVTPESQATFGLSEPIGAVLRADGMLRASDNTEVNLGAFKALSIETEIGFVVGKRIDRRLHSLDEFRDHISAIVPVVELPAGEWKQPKGVPPATDHAATNIRSKAYIVGGHVPKERVDFNQLRLRLSKDGAILHQAKGADCWKGPWETGLWLAQFAHRQGITLEPGQVIICGALGKIHPGKKGRYVYAADALGEISFTLK